MNLNWNEIIASPDFDVYENARRVINQQMSVDEFCDAYINDEEDAGRVFIVQLLITKLDENSDLQEIIENAIKRRGELTGNCCENCHEDEDEDEDEEVSGIVCKKCGIELPQMLMSEHLDINNPKNKMCGCR